MGLISTLALNQTRPLHDPNPNPNANPNEPQVMGRFQTSGTSKTRPLEELPTEAYAELQAKVKGVEKVAH